MLVFTKKKKKEEYKERGRDRERISFGVRSGSIPS